MSEHRRGNQKINNSEKLDTYDAQDEVRKKKPTQYVRKHKHK
jgi:hypothetical protein